MRSLFIKIGSATVLAALLSVLPFEGAVAADDRKYHPGHYISMNRWDKRSRISDVIRPGVAGIQVRYAWAELEPVKDQYDFSAIHADLDMLAGTGRYLVAFLLDKSFKDEYYTPAYIEPYTLPSNYASGGGGYVSKRWDPYVVDRVTRLVQAIAAEFDDHPQFEGLAFQESAHGIPLDVLDQVGYTPEAYRDALIVQLRNAAAAFEKSRVFWYMNFLARNNGYMADVRDAVVPYGVAIGGPDLLPGQYSLEKHTYPVLKGTRNGVRFNSAQNDSFRHESSGGGYWTPAELLEYAKEELELCYIFWNRVPKPMEDGSYSIDDAFPVMAEHPEICGVRPMPPVLVGSSG